MAWIAELWLDVLGADVTRRGDDFFDLGGGSLTAAQMVSRLRERFPEVAVGDIYENPTRRLARGLPGRAAAPARPRPHRPADPAQDPDRPGGRDHAAARARRRRTGWSGWGSAPGCWPTSSAGLLPQLSWWLLALGWLVFVTPPGRMLLAAAGARLLLRASSRATTHAAAGSTSGCGWPSAWSTSSAPPVWPARRG